MNQQLFQTPVLFLIFNRAAVTQRVFEQIKQIRPKYLYIAADGPRADRADDEDQCRKTRSIVEQIDWNCELRTLFRTENLGCGPAVSSAISWFFEHVEGGIILEDDCFPNLSFFPYCEDLLIRYQQTEAVKFIGGNNFQNGTLRGQASYYFSHYPTSWGWATWKRSWQLFKADISDVDATFANGELNAVFTCEKEKTHWEKSIIKASKDAKSIWDFHFYYAIWKSSGICITPNKNMVVNLGFFDQGTHFFLKDSTKTNVKPDTIEFPLIHPDILTVNKTADRYTFDHFYSHSISRAFRLLKENDLLSIYTYFKNRMLN